jgi:hypothetical protein
MEEENIESILSSLGYQEDFIVLDRLKKGNIIPVVQPLKTGITETIHYNVMNMRELVKTFYELYSKNAPREQFTEAFMKAQVKNEEQIHDFMARIEKIKDDKLIKVLDRIENKDGTTSITFKTINIDEKKKYIRALSKKLVKKITKKQLTEMFEQIVVKLNDTNTIKKANKALDKVKPKLEGKRGCYKIVIDDINLYLVG